MMGISSTTSSDASAVNVPTVRFQGFMEPWEERKLGSIVRRVVRKNENGESDLPLTISAQHGLVDQRTYFSKQIASKNLNGYFLLRRGEFAYNKSTSSESPWGAVKRLVDHEQGCVSTLYICFELLEADPNFIIAYYETDRWFGEMQKIASEGARNHGLLNIAPDDFFNTELRIPPSLPEQRAIGSLFSRIDELISLHQQKHDRLSAVKASLLEKMFPEPGATTPALRLAGFTEPWEEREFGKFAKLSRGLTYSPKDIVESNKGVRVLRSSNINEDVFELHDDDVFVRDAAASIPLSQNGEILITAANGSDRLVGKHALISDLVGKAVHGGFMLKATCRNPGFLNAAMGSRWYSEFLSANVAGGNGALGNLDMKALSSCYVAIPGDEEQRAIGALFDNLDSLIQAQQQKVDRLRAVKASLLDKMFV